MTLDEAEDRTRNPISQTVREIGDRIGVLEPQRTIWDDVVLPEELLRRTQYETSGSGDGGVEDRGLENSFMSNLNEDMVRGYMESGIDVRSELPYSPIDPMTMQPLGKAVPSEDYVKAFDEKFSSVFGGNSDSGSERGGYGRSDSFGDRESSGGYGGMGGI